jgi:hypothetical protein
VDGQQPPNYVACVVAVFCILALFLPTSSTQEQQSPALQVYQDR